MTAPTHIAFAEFVYLLLLTTAGVAVSAANALVVALASIAADIDTGSSILGKTMPAVSLRIERHVGHRTLTHSVLAVAGLALVALPLWWASREIYLCLVVGYATHPFLDTMNVGGVRLFYPFASVRCVFPFDVGAPGRFRTPTGSGIDRALGALFFAACIPAFVISAQGHERFIRITQRTIESAVRDYNEFCVSHRVVAEFTARSLFTRESISGRYEIAGALDERTLLFRDDQGILHSLGRAYEAEYSAESAVCYPSEPVRTAVRSLELKDQPLGSLEDALEPGARVMVFGELLMHEALELSASPGLFTPVTGSGRILKLRFASLGDLRRLGLAALLVARGRVVLRTELPAALDAVRHVQEPDSSVGFALVSFRCPSLQAFEITASIGEAVTPGQVLGRIRPDSAARLARELASARRAALTEEELSQLAALQARVRLFREQCVAESLEVLRLMQLQREGFVPAAKLVEAERTLQQARDRVLFAQDRTSSLLAKLGHRARADSMKARSGADESKRVLRSDCRGVIHDIRRSEDHTLVTFVIKKGPL